MTTNAFILTFVLLFGAVACSEIETGDDSGLVQHGDGGIIRGGEPNEATVNNAGPYRVATYGLFGRGDVRDGWEYADFEIYYPDGARPPFSMVAIVPGFISDRSWVGDWAPFVASHGIVAILIDTNWLTDEPDARKRALLDALESLKAENERAGGPLQGKLDKSRTGVIGWSMGGGGALLAGAQDPSLKAVIALCPWNLFTVGFIGMQVPSLQFGATGDLVAGAGMTYEFYNAIPPATPKILFNLAGGDHWYANSPSGHWSSVGRFGISFLKTFLEGDTRYRKFLTVEPLGLDHFAHNL